MFRRFYIPNEHVEAKIQEQKEAEKEAAKVSDSGCATPTKEPVVGQLVDVSEPAEKTDDVPNYSGLTHAARAPTLSKEQIENLAQRFADAIPEREFSMATLQGYLMSYKVRPVQAVEDVARWIVDKEEEGKRRGRFGKAE
ncbi:hypothetical protein EWM64_g3994 [Hericium alpestre]|uniref:Mitochondrial chaperone BCS1-like ATPase lid domain-containing protein n=1 Tax=Hericium alpestre TaxID=135208 RepID=A0A4Z0A125_9AGAM|nr:hypothetical protein EWM64_g3994 [Hericium alpestre]